MKIVKYLASLCLLIYSQLCLASTQLPWETPMDKIMHSLTGPVAKILGVIVICLAGLGLAFGEAGTGTRRMFQVVLGLSIAFTASSIVATLFGVGSVGAY